MSPAAPCEGAESVSSTMGLRLRLLGEPMSLAVATNLLLDVVPSSVVSCFFEVMTCWRDFLKIDLIGEKSERWDPNLNESTSLWWRFTAANNQTVDSYHKQEYN